MIIDEDGAKESFRKNTESAVIKTIVTAINQIELFIDSDPSLTRTQWSRIDYTVKQLKNLIFNSEVA